MQKKYNKNKKKYHIKNVKNQEKLKDKFEAALYNKTIGSIGNKYRQKTEE